MAADTTEHRRLAAIMFTDMVGYSRLAQKNEALAIELLEEQRCLLRAQFAEFHGLEVDCAGDGFFVEFTNALEAARCAIAIQNLLAARNSKEPPDRALHVRIGIHVGDVVHRAGKVMGDAVNIAARIEPLAEPGGVCVSRAVYEQIQNKVSEKLVQLTNPNLKNIHTNVEVYRIHLGKAASTAHPDQRATASTWAGRKKTASSVAVMVGSGVMVLVCAAALWLFVNAHKRSLSHLETPAKKAETANNGDTAKQRPQITSIAVLPLHNLSHNTNQDYFVDGITQMLCSELSGVSALKKVISPTTMMRYKTASKTTREIASELGVDALLEGSVQHGGDMVIVSVQLSEGLTERQFWGTNYQRDVGNLLKLEADLAKAIATEIQAKLTPHEASRLASAHTVNPAALEAYLRGRDYLAHFEMQRSLESLQQAVTLDPNYALGHAALAHFYIGAAFLGDRMPKLMLEQTRQSAQRSLDLDSTLVGAQTAIGWAKMMLDWDWAGAEQELRAATEASPSDAGAHNLLGFLLTARGRFDEAEIQMKLTQQLDPLSWDSNVWAYFPALMQGRYDEVIEQGKALLQRNKDFYPILGLVGAAYLQKQQFPEAIARYRELLNHPGQGWDIQAQAALASAYALSGQREEALKTLNALKNLGKRAYLPAYEIALISVALGEKDQAIAWLNRAYEDRSGFIYLLKVQPAFTGLHADAEFKALLKKMKLAD